MRASGWSVIAAYLSAALMLVGGCVARRGPARPGATAPSTSPLATTSPVSEPRAELSLDQILPVVTLPAPAASTRPADQPPPLEAIELFARARDALLQNQRYTAINLLEKAVKLDPDSYELWFTLGQAYQGIGGSADRALAAFEQAARIRPDDIEVQTELGRAYQSRGDLNRAIERFRMARQTTEYRQAEDPLALVVDYRLAVLLQQQGYDRAALDCYQSLLRRIQRNGIRFRASPEASYLQAHPHLIYEQIGTLHEKRGEFEQALRAYQNVADRAPNDFEHQARLVRLRVKLGQHQQAIASAADLVRRFHASSESIQLLRQVYQELGRQEDFVQELWKLHRQQPQDRAILFALADTLAEAGREAEAAALLRDAIRSHDGDLEIVERLWRLYADRDRVTDAARLIIEVCADHPDATSELTPLLLDLTRLSRRHALRLGGLQKLAVRPDAEAAKQYWIWRVASGWSRANTARAALEQAAAANPPFDPACRALLDSYLSRSDWDQTSRQRAVDELIESVRSRGRADLAAELRGLVELRADRAEAAVEAFSQAVQLASASQRRPSPDLQLQLALALHKSQRTSQFEQLMWKLISERPRFAPAYQLLLSYYRQNNSPHNARDLLEKWLAADPTSITARVQQAAELVQQRRANDAIELIRRLFEQHPDDADVVTSLVLLFNAAGRSQEAVELLEAERAKDPGNRTVVEALIEIYVSQNRTADATRVLDAARQAVAQDPDLLYYLAHLYQRIGQQQLTEQLLQEVLRLDPTHAPAGNDLGYTWADAGKNLDRAEALIRVAVQAEPDNPSYLDSLGWVLYKRGRFAEALRWLEQAAQPAEQADPVVLDHLGDVLYRLNRHAEAQQAWEKSLERLGQVPPRDELNSLRLQLQAKLKQAQSNQPVNVAPVVEAGESQGQANRN
ncbi:tetratricopeptide repeat protein [Fontivita pretiosa]|uniref:tetratricopeptide repeat protein n=1 Tax=Fontivita pretiosa TaxID=2989684 RepID=UPI003D16757E